MSYSQAAKSPAKDAEKKDPAKMGKYSVCHQNPRQVFQDAGSAISQHSYFRHNQDHSRQDSGKKYPAWKTADYGFERKPGQIRYNRKTTHHEETSPKYLRDVAKTLSDRYFLNDKDVTAENVLDTICKTGKLDRAQNTALFLERMLKEQRMLAEGKPVKTEMILKEYENSIKECKKLIAQGKIKVERLDFIRNSLAIFYEYLYLNNITLYGNNITPDTVISTIPDSNSGKTTLARFYEKLYIKGKSLNSGTISAEMVDEKYQHANAPVDRTRFHEWLFINRRTIYGKPPDFITILNNFIKLGKPKEASIFLSQSLSEKITDVKPEDLKYLKGLIDKSRDIDKLTKAIVYETLYRKNLLPGVSPEEILSMYPSDTKTAKIARTRFRRNIYFDIARNDEKHLHAKEIIKELEDLNALKELGIFYIKLFSKGVYIPGKTSTPEMVNETLKKMKQPLSLAFFLEYLCLNYIHLNNRPVDPETVITAFKAAGNCDDALGIFYYSIYQKKLKINGQPVTQDQIHRYLQHYPKTLSRINSYLRQSDKSMQDMEYMEAPELTRNYPVISAQNCMYEFLANTSSQLTAEQVLKCFPDTTDGNKSKAFFYLVYFLRAFHAKIHQQQNTLLICMNH